MSIIDDIKEKMLYSRVNERLKELDKEFSSIINNEALTFQQKVEQCEKLEEKYTGIRTRGTLVYEDESGKHFDEIDATCYGYQMINAEPKEV